MPDKLYARSKKTVAEYRSRQTHNLFSVYIPAIDQFTTPLQTKVKTQSELLVIQRNFAEYIAKVIKEKIIQRINSQKFFRDYPKYSDGYMKWKEEEGYGTPERPNWWKNSGALLNAITVWRTGNIFVVGIPENIKHPVYKSKGGKPYPMYRILKVLEFGYPPSNIQPRPLFFPVFQAVAKHMGRYLETFLSTYDPLKTKIKRNRRTNPTQLSEKVGDDDGVQSSRL